MIQVKNKKKRLGFLSHTKEILPFFKNFKNYNRVKNAEFAKKLSKREENVDGNFIDFIFNDIKNNLPLSKEEIDLTRASKNEIALTKIYNFKDGFQVSKIIVIIDDEEMFLDYDISFKSVSWWDTITLRLDGKGNNLLTEAKTIEYVIDELPRLYVIEKHIHKKHFKYLKDKIERTEFLK